VAVAYVGAGTRAAFAGGSSAAPSKTCTAGNLVVLTCCVSRGDTAATAFSTPSGWSVAQAPAGAAIGATYSPVVAIFYKLSSAGGTESATVTAPFGSYGWAQIEEFSGGPFTFTGAQSAHAEFTTGATSRATGTTGANSIADAVVIAVGHPEDTTGSTSALGTPSTYTSIDLEAANNAEVAWSNAYKLLSSTGTQSATHNWTTNSYYAGAIAIFEGPSGGGSSADMTPAAGVATSSTMATSAAKTSTATAAAGVATSSTMVGRSTAASSMTVAAGTATASTMVGRAGAAATMTPAAGAATSTTMAGSAASAAGMTAAAGTSTAATMATSAVKVASMVPAAGVATSATMVGSSASAGTANMVPAAGQATTGTLAGASVAAASMVPAAGQATTATMSTGGAAPAPAPAPGGTEFGPGRFRNFKPLLQRILEARYPRVKPRGERAQKRAKAIENEGAELVLEGAPTATEFEALAAQWMAQNPVMPAPDVDPMAVYLAQVGFRLRQRQAEIEAAELRRRQDEDAILVLLLA